MGKLGPNVETQVPLKPLWFITVGFHIELNFNWKFATGNLYICYNNLFVAAGSDVKWRYVFSNATHILLSVHSGCLLSIYIQIR